jgi:nucleotide-binding universal stress UspA family protein
MASSSGPAPAQPGRHGGSVLVELRDGSAARVVSWAAGWADSQHLPLSVLAAHPVGRRHVLVRRRLRRLARLRFDLVLGALRSRHPALQVEEHLAWDDIVDAILSRGDEAGAVVMQRAGERSRPNGNVLRVAGRAPCPVIVLPEDAGQVPQVGPVVLGLDDSPEAWEAAEFALEVAQRWRSDLVVVQAWEARSATGRRLDVTLRADESTARDRLAPVGARLQQLRPDVSVTTEVVRGAPVPGLLAHARHAALLVVGSRGCGGAPGLLLGSVSRELLCTSPVPVAVARTPRTGAADRREDDEQVSAGAASAPTVEGERR